MTTFNLALGQMTASAAAAVRICWSIDRTSKAAGGADNGFLDCARAHTPGYGSHSSTAECVTNLSNCLGAGGGGIANVVGHGNDGLIVTGQGQSPSDPQKFITTWNENIWGPLVRTLRGKATTIKLWACHPGTAQAGADLLFAMMNETGATCMGPTGFLYCGPQGFSLEANSTWQVSSPGSPKPAPIPAPTAHFLISVQEWRFLVKPSGALGLDTLTKLEIERNGQRLLSVTGDSAKGIARMIDLANPEKTDLVAGALVTGRLALTFRDALGEKTVRFLILNNRLLQREDEPTVYYHCSEAFGGVLNAGFAF